MSQRGLVLEFDANSGILYCFDKDCLQLVRLKLSPSCAVPRPGFFVFYDQSQCSSDVPIEHLAVEAPREEDYVDIYPQSNQFFLRAWVGFSDDPNHSTYSKRVGFADFYGLVAIPEEIRSAKHGKPKLPLENGAVYTSFLVVNDLDFEKNGTQLFKLDRIKFKVVGHVKAAEVARILALMRTDTVLEPTPEIPEPTFVNADPTSTSAIGMKFEQGHVLFWLDDVKKAAVYPCDQKESMQFLGKTFNCHYRDVQGELVVTAVLRETMQQPFRVKQVDSETFEARLEVNLYRPHTEFREFMIYTQTGILKSDLYDMIVCNDRIDTPARGSGPFWSMMQVYMGNPVAKSMAGWCRLEKQRVPQRNTDDTVVRYTWTLYKVIGSMQMVLSSEQRRDKENLGVNMTAYQQEDDIARMKRLNIN